MNKEILDKFSRNECTPEEVRMVREYLLKNKNKEEAHEFLKKEWESPDILSDNENRKAHLFQGIIQDIKKEDATPVLSVNRDTVVDESEKQYKIPLTAIYQKWWSVAAMIVLAIGVSFALFYLEGSQVEEVVELPQEIIKANPSGQRSRIVLRDGTKIHLNAESLVRYSDKDYGVKNREIYLEGEAYFEVAKNKEVPFIVTTRHSSTTALGTAFNVRAFPEEGTSKISLTEGKVKVLHTHLTAQEGMILNPSEEAVVEGKGLTKRAFDPLSVVAWKDGVIYFEETDFNEAVRTLERWYNVSFDVQNLPSGAEELKGTGTFENETLENVLEALSYSLDFQYEIDNKVVIVKF